MEVIRLADTPKKKNSKSLVASSAQQMDENWRHGSRYEYLTHRLTAMIQRYTPKRVLRQLEREIARSAAKWHGEWGGAKGPCASQ